MFGNCPRSLWETWAAPDARHRIDLACRCLLVEEDSGRTVLLEAGIGAFFEPKLRDRFGVMESEHVLLHSLAALGKRPEDIDAVVLSHLHFDHAGGLLSVYQPGQPLELVFPRAQFFVGREALARARKPHSRDRASFIAELLPLLDASGRLVEVTSETSPLLGANYTFTYSHGHTPGLMLTRVAGHTSGAVTFLGDLVPGAAWVHLPITMGYDRFPELLIEEKELLLAQMVAAGDYAFFTHDPAVSHARVACDAKGRFSADEKHAALVWS